MRENDDARVSVDLHLFGRPFRPESNWAQVKDNPPLCVFRPVGWNGGLTIFGELPDIEKLYHALGVAISEYHVKYGNSDDADAHVEAALDAEQGK